MMMVVDALICPGSDLQTYHNKLHEHFLLIDVSSLGGINYNKTRMKIGHHSRA